MENKGLGGTVRRGSRPACHVYRTELKKSRLRGHQESKEVNTQRTAGIKLGLRLYVRPGLAGKVDKYPVGETLLMITIAAVQKKNGGWVGRDTLKEKRRIPQ